MNRCFRFFCITWFGLGPLNYQSSRSDFGFKFAEIFEIEKLLPASVIAGSRQDCLEYSFFQTNKQTNFDSSLHPWIIFCQIGHLKAFFSRLKF
jgi:hypothetical protein